MGSVLDASLLLLCQISFGCGDVCMTLTETEQAHQYQKGSEYIDWGTE